MSTEGADVDLVGETGGELSEFTGSVTLKVAADSSVCSDDAFEEDDGSSTLVVWFAEDSYKKNIIHC